MLWFAVFPGQFYVDNSVDNFLLLFFCHCGQAVDNFFSIVAQKPHQNLSTVYPQVS